MKFLATPLHATSEVTRCCCCSHATVTCTLCGLFHILRWKIKYDDDDDDATISAIEDPFRTNFMVVYRFFFSISRFF